MSIRTSYEIEYPDNFFDLLDQKDFDAILEWEFTVNGARDKFTRDLINTNMLTEVWQEVGVISDLSDKNKLKLPIISLADWDISGWKLPPVKVIGSSVFEDCELSNIELPSTIEHIQNRAFRNALARSYDQRVSLGSCNNLTSIGGEAFKRKITTYNLQIILPNSVKYISKDAFDAIDTTQIIYLGTRDELDKIEILELGIPLAECKNMVDYYKNIYLASDCSFDQTNITTNSYISGCMCSSSSLAATGTITVNTSAITGTTTLTISDPSVISATELKLNGTLMRGADGSVTWYNDDSEQEKMLKAKMKQLEEDYKALSAIFDN